jgi:osmoprotectant transport system permease protein
MDERQSLWQFMMQQSDKLLNQTVTHIGLTFSSVLLAVIVGLPLGIFISRKKKIAGFVLGFAGALQTIPSVALLGFMIPLLGIGTLPAIAALFLYGLLPIIRNTYTGIRSVSPEVKDAARGMGMSPKQVLFKVELPLSLPMILAGIRTTTVINVGVATLAAYIAAGGLGEFIFGGIALNNRNMILAGAIPAALLAILFDFLLSRLQKFRMKHARLMIWLLPLALLLLSSFYILPSAKQKMLAGFEAEFMGRKDGYPGLKAKYHLRIPSVVVNDAIMYNAIFEHRVDLIGGYSTDGRLKAFDLLTLDDDKHVFPPYYVAPVVRKEVLERHPELESILNQLAGMINDSAMTDLNYRTDCLHQSPERVAREFLIRRGLWKEPMSAGSESIRIGSKIFGEQYILAEMYSMLIRGNSNLNVETKTGLGGTKICFDALNHDQIDLYPEYSGTGLLVLLQPDERTIDSLSVDRDKVYSFVKDEFERQYQLIWLKPVGFNNTYALMMRRTEAAQLKIQTISDLQKYLNSHEPK